MKVYSKFILELINETGEPKNATTLINDTPWS